MFTGSTLIFGVPLLLGGAAGVGWWIWRQRRRNAEIGPAEAAADGLASLSDADFEALVTEAFQRQGYQVIDGGRSARVVTLRRDRETHLLQCRHRHVAKVGVDAVQRCTGKLSARGANGGFMLTEGRFSREATALAASCNFRLLEGEAVRGWSSRCWRSVTARNARRALSDTVVPCASRAWSAAAHSFRLIALLECGHFQLEATHHETSAQAPARLRPTGRAHRLRQRRHRRSTRRRGPGRAVRPRRARCARGDAVPRHGRTADATNVTHPFASNYFDVDSSDADWSVKTTVGGLDVGTVRIDPNRGTKYTVVALQTSATTAGTYLIADPYNKPLGSDSTRLRVMNASYNTASVDVYMNAPGTDIATVTPLSPPRRSASPGRSPAATRSTSRGHLSGDDHLGRHEDGGVPGEISFAKNEDVLILTVPMPARPAASARW